MKFEILMPFSILGGQLYNFLQAVIIIKINKKNNKMFTLFLHCYLIINIL